MPTSLAAHLTGAAHRLSRGRPLVAAFCVAALGLLGGGVATGWFLSDRFSPRSAPEIQVTIAPDLGSDAEGVTMPDVRGLDVATAQQVLADVGLGGVEITEQEQPWVGAAGKVVGQEPIGGSPDPSQITLHVSAAAVIPDIVGTDVNDAVRTLQLLGAEVVVHRVYRDGVPADQTLEVSPPAGSPIPDQVEVTASTAPSILDLTDLRTQSSSCSMSTNLIVNGTKYADGLTCRGGKDYASAVYLLGRHAAQLKVVVGQPDTVAPGTSMLLEVVTDGNVAYSKSLGYGQATEITIDTGGALQLELRARLDPPPTDSTRGTAVFAGPQLIGDGAELLALKDLTA